MKAISIKQPWAWLILNAGKDIENREWSTVVRGPVLIHAGKSMDEAGIRFCKQRGISLPPLSDLKLGGIVGKVEITGCVRQSKSPWFFGTYGFELTNPQTLPFKPVKGKLKFFEVDYEYL